MKLGQRGWRPSPRSGTYRRGRAHPIYLPSVEALSASDDTRLLAELEICQVVRRLAVARALVARADRVLGTVLACGETAEPADDVLGGDAPPSARAPTSPVGEVHSK